MQRFLICKSENLGGAGKPHLTAPEVPELPFSRELYIISFFFSEHFEMLTVTHDAGIHAVLECVISIAIQYIQYLL